MEWVDIQTTEAMVRTRSVAATGRELNIQHSSVSRRIASMERTIGTALFLRGPTLVPTPLALQIAEHGVVMRRAAERVRDLVSADQRRRAGHLVITTNDTLGPLLFEALGSCDLESRVEVVVNDAELRLRPGEVDLALRPDEQPAGDLRGRRLGRVRLGVYRSVDFRSTTGRWVLPSSSLRARESLRWLREIPLDAPGVVECDSLLAMRDACVAGLGWAPLPAFLGESDDRLVLERPLPPGPTIWLLSPATRVPDALVARARDGIAEALLRLQGAWHQTA